MTENEAIEELKYDCNEIGKAIPCDTSWGESFENAYAMAINALEEVQQYLSLIHIQMCIRDRLMILAKLLYILCYLEDIDKKVSAKFQLQ